MSTRGVEQEEAGGRVELSTRYLLVAVLAVLALGLLSQFGASLYMRGDGDYYLRDAARFANGDLPTSRYTPGFALLLAPFMWATSDNASMVGNIALVLNAALAVGGFALMYRLLRAWLTPIVAVVTVAVVAFSQGVLVYFAEVRPEPLMLLLVNGMLLAMVRKRGGWAVALGTVAMLVRIAIAPFVVVTIAVWARHRPRLLAALALFLVVAGAWQLAGHRSIGESYFEVGGPTFQAHTGVVSRAEDAIRTAGLGVTQYGRYGLPRFVWPYRLLHGPVGPVVGFGTTLGMVVGLLLMLRPARPGRDGTAHRDVLAAACAGLALQVAVLLIWPIRHLSAVRMVVPIAVLPMLGLAAAVVAVVRRTGPRSRIPAAAVLGLLAAASALGSAAVLRVGDADQSLRGFVAANREAAPLLPPGPVVSSQPGATELITGRRSLDYPVAVDLVTFVTRTRVCAFVVQADTDRDTKSWIDRHARATIARARTTTVIALEEAWC